MDELKLRQLADLKATAGALAEAIDAITAELMTDCTGPMATSVSDDYGTIATVSVGPAPLAWSDEMQMDLVRRTAGTPEVIRAFPPKITAATVAAVCKSTDPAIIAVNVDQIVAEVQDLGRQAQARAGKSWMLKVQVAPDRKTEAAEIGRAHV